MGRFGWNAWGLETEREIAERRVMMRRLRAAVVTARGTGRMTQLRAKTDPPGDMKTLAATLSDALAREQYSEARAALRKVRAADFDGDAGIVEACLGVIRDARSSEEELADAIRDLCSLAER